MNTAPEFTLELPDSEVRYLVWHGTDLHLSFAAACVRRVDAATGEVEQGYLCGVELHLHHAQTHDALTDALGRLRQGRLSPACPLHLPSQHPGPLRLTLEFANGTLLNLRAQGLTAVRTAGSTFFPSLAC